MKRSKHQKKKQTKKVGYAGEGHKITIRSIRNRVKYAEAA
jgi:hypothetical protein